MRKTARPVVWESARAQSLALDPIKGGGSWRSSNTRRNYGAGIDSDGWVILGDQAPAGVLRAALTGFPGALYTAYNTMRFEWDAAKNRANQAKHEGVDFETAARVFDDPDMLLLEDRVVAGEQRWHAIGAVTLRQRSC
jgi:hypothetical protein